MSPPNPGAPENQPDAVISFDDYRKKREAVISEEPKFVLTLTGQMTLDEIDELIEDITSSDLTVQGVWILEDVPDEPLTAANDDVSDDNKQDDV